MTTATSSASELLAAGAVVFLLVEIGEAASVAADGLLEGEREPLPFVRGAFVAIEHLERADAGVVDEVVCAQEVGVLAGDEGLVPDDLAD